MVLAEKNTLIQEIDALIEKAVVYANGTSNHTTEMAAIQKKLEETRKMVEAVNV